MNFYSRFKNTLRLLFSFSEGERRGILWLLPLLAVLSVSIAALNRPSFETGLLEIADREDLPGYADNTAPRDGAATADNPEELFSFDPNTATLQELVALGLDMGTAAGIIKYRERGKRFEIPEDFASCYGITLDDYNRLESYISIAEEYRVKRWDTYPEARHTGEEEGGSALRATAPKAVPDKPFDPNVLDAAGFEKLGFSPAQAGVIIRYRESLGGFDSAEELARCYVVSEDDFARLSRFMVFPERTASPDNENGAGETAQQPGADAEQVRPKVELNGADSMELRGVSGIGEVLVARIMEYRGRLGGFYDMTQLAEIRGMTGANYERIIEQIWVDSCEIQKIDINFATHKTLAARLGGHPYVTDKTLRRLLKQRQMKGGWRTIADMVDENIVTEEEAERLAPYLIFRKE